MIEWSKIAPEKFSFETIVEELEKGKWSGCNTSLIKKADRTRMQDYLITRIRSQPKEQTVQEELNSLAHLESQTALEFLVTYSEDESVFDRHLEAIDAIGQFFRVYYGFSSFYTPLLPFLKDFKNKQPEIEDFLIKYLNNPKTKDKICAVWMLGRVGREKTQRAFQFLYMMPEQNFDEDEWYPQNYDFYEDKGYGKPYIHFQRDISFTLGKIHERTRK